MHHSIYQFAIDKGIDSAITAFSVYIAFRLGVSHEKAKEKRQESDKRINLLSELSKSFDENLDYLNQITDLHIPRGEIPTFVLDTAWLHYLISEACFSIPKVSGYRNKYNKLRFELDHINQKLLLAHHLGFKFLKESVLPHVEAAKVAIKREQETLKPLLQ